MYPNDTKFEVFYLLYSVDTAPVSKLLLGTVASVSTALIVAGPIYKSYFMYSNDTKFEVFDIFYSVDKAPVSKLLLGDSSISLNRSHRCWPRLQKAISSTLQNLFSTKYR